MTAFNSTNSILIVNTETKRNFQKYIKSVSLNLKNIEIEALVEDRRIEHSSSFSNYAK